MGPGVSLVLLPPDLLSARWALNRSGAEFLGARLSADIRSAPGVRPVWCSAQMFRRKRSSGLTPLAGWSLLHRGYRDVSFQVPLH